MTADADELARLRTRIANLERLTERLAHELATPLTTVQIFARILLDGEGLSSEVRQGLERIERAGTTAMELLQHRVAEAPGEQPRSLRLRELVRDAVTGVWGEDAPGGRDLPEDARVFGDPVGIRHALGLVLQALLPPDGVRGVDDLEVTLARVRPAAYQLRLAVPRLEDAGVAERDARLVTAGAVLAGLGGRLWDDDGDRTAGGRSILVELQRDVVEGASGT